MTAKFVIPSLFYLWRAAWSCFLGVVFRFRLIPFMQTDTILAGGRQVPAEEVARTASILFFSGAALIGTVAIVGVLTLSEARRAYIAQLPRWKQWFYWPFGRSFPTDHATKQPSTSPPAA